MKKVLSIILSVLMVVSCMTCMFTTSVSAADEPLRSYVSFNQASDKNLMAGFNADYYVKSYSPNYKSNINKTAKDKTQADETADGVDYIYSQGPAVYLSAHVNYQKYYIPLANPTCTDNSDLGTSVMQLGRSYNLTFYLNYTGTAKVSIMYDLAYNLANDGTLSGTSGATVTTGTADENGWIKYTATITPTVNKVFSIYIDFGNVPASTCAISDISLYATDIRISADSAGTNGTATAVAGENNVTFTAVPYQESEFLGWYDGETLLGTDTTYTYTYETVTEKVITAKFSDINLLYGKNLPNAKQKSETANDTGSTIYSAVTDTEGWWSNGWPSGKYTVSNLSHLGGDAIFNSSVGYQYHVFTMHVKPNTTYSLQFSLLATHKVRYLGIFDNTGLFGYTVTDGGAGSGGQPKETLIPMHKWISSATDCSTYKTYTYEFTTNDSTEEYLPYYLYFGYGVEEAGANASSYTTGTYISDMSLVEYIRYDATPAVIGNGAVKTSHQVAAPGTQVTFTANAYTGSKFLGYYEDDTLLTTDATYTYTANADTNVTAKFSGINIAPDVKISDWYRYNGNGTTDCHTPYPATVGDVNLGGGSYVFSSVNYSYRYFYVDLAANTKYDISYYLKAYGSESSALLEAIATVYKKAEVQNYSVNKDVIKAEYEAGERDYNYNSDLWEFRPTKFPDYCTYRKECGGGYTATSEFTRVATQFTTDTAGGYIIVIKFTEATGSVNISDISLSPVVTANVLTEGSGDATVTENNDVYTFTAEPYEGCEFIGWYNGGTIVSTDLVYDVTNLAADLTLTAKFTASANLLVGFTKDNFVQRGETWAGKADTTVTVGESTINAVQLQNSGESGGKYYGTAWRTSAINLTAGHTYELQINVKSYFSVAYVGIISVDSYTDSANPDDKTPWLEVSPWTAVSAKDGVMILDNSTLAELKTFTPTVSGDYYICVAFGSILSPTEDEIANMAEYKKAYIYGLSLVDATTYDVTVTSTGNGAAKASPAKVSPGAATTLTATEYASGGSFLGWFKDGKFVSSEKVMLLENVNADTAYVAKFTKTNVAKDINYIGTSYKSTVAEASTGDGWKKSTINSWVTLSNANEESRYGGTAIKATGTVQHQAFWLPIELKSGTEYSMSFSYLTYGVKANYIKLYDSSNFDIYDTLEEDPNKNYGGKVLTEFAQNEMVAFVNTDSVIASFTDYSKTFTTPESENATETFYLIVKHNDLTSDNSDGAADYAILSDLSIVETATADLEFATFTGNSIRSTGNQALRFKYDISSDILTNGFDGLTVKEVGAVTIRTSYLGGKALTLDGVYTNAAGKEVSMAKGNLAYGTFTQEMLEDSPAVALYNIGGMRDPMGNILSVDYTAYGDSYTVRAYMIVDLNGTEVVFYGEERAASVFAVMEEIQEQYAEDASNQTDYAAVTDVLATAADGDKTIQTYYDAWLDAKNA